MSTAKETPVQERQRRIVEHYSLVRIIASRMVRRFPGHVEVDELVNTGMLGLIDAVDRFDPERGVPFKAYAEIRIRGSIVDALRGADWVPRAVRRTFARIDSTRTELRRRLGRDPTREEMARSLEVSVDAYDDLSDGAQIRSIVSLETPTSDEGDGRLADQLAGEFTSPVETWIDRERHEGVVDAIEELPEKERTVVTLYYQRGLSLKEIGATLGVTESRACQLRGQAVKRLQQKVHARALE